VTPLTLTFFQLFSINLFSFSLKYEKIKVEGSYLWYLIPLAVGKFAASVTSHWSLWRVGVNFVHTVKATAPIFVLILTRLFLGQKHSMRVYLTILPITAGVMVTSLTELEFDSKGLVIALMSTLFFTLQNLFSKLFIEKSRMHTFQLLRILAFFSFAMFSPVFAYNYHALFSNLTPHVLLLLLLDGFLCFLQNLAAFLLLKILTALSYSIGGCLKRVFVIFVGILVFNKEISLLNFGGSCLAVWGVFYYSGVKKMEDEKKRRLPFYNNAELNNNIM